MLSSEEIHRTCEENIIVQSAAILDIGIMSQCGLKNTEI